MWDWEVTDNAEISDEMEMGQWNSQMDLNNEGGDIDVGAQEDHHSDHDAGGSAEPYSVAGGDVVTVDSAVQSEPIQNPTTDMEIDSAQHLDQDSSLNQDMMNGIDSDDFDETPRRFRSLNEVYQYSQVVNLDSDTDEENAGNAGQNDAVELVALLTVMEEPTCFSDAENDPNWVQAMDDEMHSICKNGTWELATLPPG